MKSKMTAALLAFFLGGLGVHRFYMGQQKGGLVTLALFFIGLSSIVALIDFILLLMDSEEKFQARLEDKDKLFLFA